MPKAKITKEATESLKHFKVTLWVEPSVERQLKTKFFTGAIEPEYAIEVIEREEKSPDHTTISESFVKSFDVPGHLASTLHPEDLGVHPEPDGWTVTGEIQEDYYEWVNDFVATHPKYGKVEGNFESSVVATSEVAYQHFIKFHPPNDWDYWDI
jgi:hypothetical protein